MSLIQSKASQNQTPFVFSSFGGLSHLFDRILKRAGIPKKDELGHKLTAHSFRHTYATLVAQSVKCNPFLLKEILGHSQISTTERYCHPTTTATVIDIIPYMGVSEGCKEDKNSEEYQTTIPITCSKSMLENGG